MLKKIPKIILALFLSIFIIQLIGLAIILIQPQPAQAVTNAATFVPQVGIGDFLKGTPYTPNGTTAMIGQYIRAIYKYAIGIVGILAAVILMFGGLLWITAGGNNTRISEAKAWIGASITGLLLALLSYMILATVNPALVNLQTSGVETVIATPQDNSGYGCCVNVDENGNKGCGTATKKNCDGVAGKQWMGDNYVCDNQTNSCQPMQNIALKTNGCCDGRCGSINNKADCNKYGLSWLDDNMIDYTCNSQQKCTTITKAEATKGCCEMSSGFSSLPNCKSADSPDDCQKNCSNTDLTCNFDNKKLCQVSGNRNVCRSK